MARMASVSRGPISAQLCNYGHRLVREGLTYGASGNISARNKDRIFIKAKGAWLETATPRDFIAVRIDAPGRPSGRLSAASSELKAHLSCYKVRPDIGAVFHVHAPFSTLIASSDIPFGPVSEEYHVMLEKGFKKIKHFPAGSAALAETIGRAIRATDVVFLANHGLLCVGKDMREAFLRTLVVEYTAKLIALGRLCDTRVRFLGDRRQRII